MELKKEKTGKAVPIRVETRVNTKKKLSKEVIDYSFFEMDDLFEIENSIKSAFASSTRLNLAICLALDAIQRKKLFLQAGFKNFSSYLRAETLLPNSTGSDMAFIGRRWRENQEELKGIGFTEVDGLSKLKFIPRNFKTFKEEEKREILENMREMTTTQFKSFAKKFFGEERLLISAQKSEKKLKVSEVFEIGFNEVLDGIEKNWDGKTKESFQRAFRKSFALFEARFKRYLANGKIKF